MLTYVEFIENIRVSQNPSLLTSSLHVVWSGRDLCEGGAGLHLRQEVREEHRQGRPQSILKGEITYTVRKIK